MSKNSFDNIHQQLKNENEIVDAIEQFNKTVKSVGLYFQEDNFDESGGTSFPNEEVPANTLIILGSFDFAYYHQAEIVFFDALANNIDSDYIWPDHWQRPQIELLLGDERDAGLKQFNIPDSDAHFVFRFNVGSHGDDHYIIIAKGISLHLSTIFHYDREASEPLKENERVAYWVSKSTR